MQLQESTIQLLKNFASINGNLMINAGNELTTISESKTILAKTELEESFPQDFAIYDTSDFLTCVSLLTDPVLEFQDTHVIIKSDGRKIKYFYSDPELLKTPPEGSFDKLSSALSDESDNIVIRLTQAQYAELNSAARILKGSSLSFRGEDGSITASLTEKDNSTSNTFSVTLSDYDGDDFSFSLDINQMKILAGDYEITASRSKPLSRFKNLNTNLIYYIPLDKA